MSSYAAKESNHNATNSANSARVIKPQASKQTFFEPRPNHATNALTKQFKSNPNSSWNLNTRVNTGSTTETTETKQRIEKEEPLQGRFQLVQRAEKEEKEEKLQGKFETSQRFNKCDQSNDKPFDFNARVIVQRVDKEEPIQARFKTTQRVEKEEPLQGKFDFHAPVQLERSEPKPNNTGLPDNLKSGIENLSGISMDNVKVHYNSSKPSQLNALAYAQGTDIHVAPGQEKHLPHEAWHVVQQAQGRVKPTMQMKDGVPINDDKGLEHEADVMGLKAQSEITQIQTESKKIFFPQKISEVTQGVFIDKGNFVWIDQDSGKEYQQTQVRVDNRITLSDHTDTFYINYSNGEWNRGVTVIESTLVDDSDHGPESGSDASEELIDWSELTSQGLQRFSQIHEGIVLYRIFTNMVLTMREDLPDNMFDRYQAWLHGGVYTRAKFKELIGLTPNQSDNSTNIIQRARSGNTYTLNGGYKGLSNGEDYDNVIYKRDDDGNIDFTVDPKTIVASYNLKSPDEIKKTSIKWKNPQKNISEVQMSNDLTNKHQGIMPSGKKVPLKTASRPQHFAIADMLYRNNRGGSLTWHHLTDKYKMVLVDMAVHAKHGHNGGVYIWNK